MKKMLFLSVFVFSVFFFAGCTAMQSTIREYDATGKLTKETTTKESVVKEITESTKNKTVIIWENGWTAYLSVSTATTNDPTPTAKMFAGKVAKGMISALPNEANWSGIATAVASTHEDLSVNTTGITSSNNNTVSAAGSVSK